MSAVFRAQIKLPNLSANDQRSVGSPLPRLHYKCASQKWKILHVLNKREIRQLLYAFCRYNKCALAAAFR